MSEHWTKEDVYDEQIAPLMARIIEVCEKHEIPMVASFQYENSAQIGPGYCTTALPFPHQDERMRSLNRAVTKGLNSRAHCLAETIETLPDGSQHITITRVS